MKEKCLSGYEESIADLGEIDEMREVMRNSLENDIDVEFERLLV